MPATDVAPRTVIIVGALAWVLATIQFVAAQFVVASAWKPPYSWSDNYISDLANTACGPFAVPHGAPAQVCSPLHGVMNTSFIVTGVLTVAGAVLLKRAWPASRLTTAALVLWVAAGVGKILVGLVPENTNVGLHLIGALNIPIGCCAILLAGLSVRHSRRTLSAVSIALGVVGLVGTVLSTAAQFVGPELDLGLGVGGMERVSDYPGSLWVLLIGIVALSSAGHCDQNRNQNQNQAVSVPPRSPKRTKSELAPPG
jgi:hypothetical membrane protein